MGKASSESAGIYRHAGQRLNRICLVKLPVGWCPGLKAETLDDLEKKLRETGYSDSAVKEILKWYKQNNIDRES